MRTRRIPLATVAALLGVAVTAFAQSCPPGDPVHWMADYCMLTHETDDEVVAMPCIIRETRVKFDSDCAAKLHYKRAMCAGLIRNGTRTDRVEECVADPGFVGNTVKKGGIGR